MANIPLKSMNFPGLPDTYTVPESIFGPLSTPPTAAEQVQARANIDAASTEMVLATFPRKTLASAPIHAFSDGADNIPILAMEVAVRAVQDLHGQSAPYPAGGGKNKLPLVLSDIKAANTSGTWSGNTFTAAGLTFAVQTDNGGNITGVNVSGTATAAINFRLCTNIVIPSGSYALSGAVNANAKIFALFDGTYYTDSGSGAAFTADGVNGVTCAIQISNGAALSNALFKPMIRLSTESATFAPYENLCPIVGWDEAKMVGIGKNLFGFADTPVFAAASGQLATGSGYGTCAMTETGFEMTSRNSSWGIRAVIGYFHAGDVFTVVGHCDNGNIAVSVSSDPVNGGSYTNINGSIASDTPTVITAPTDGYYLIGAFASNSNAIHCTNVCVANGSIPALVYVPFSGRIVTIAFGSTVYGGPLRYVGGKEWEFTPTWVENDMGALNWTYATNPNRFIVARSAINVAQNSTDMISSMYAVYNDAQPGADNYIYAGGSNVNCFNSAYSDAASFKTAMSGVQLVNKLVTPLDPITLYADAEVVTQYGDNVLFADCGDSSLTFRQDIGLLLEA